MSATDNLPPPAQPRGVAILGAGQHARVVASVLEAAGVAVAGHYDDDPDTWGMDIGGAKVLGPLSEVARGVRAIIGIGDNERRRQIAEGLDLDWVTVVHPFSWVHPGIRIGPGTVVCSGVTAQVGATIGAHVILNNSAGVGHDVRIGDFSHLTVSHLGAGAIAEEGVFMGIGSIVLPRVRVGAWATVGAGAVVTADIRPGVTVIGNPARTMVSGGKADDSGPTS